MKDGPVRVQRKRTKGWKMPEGAVYVGRGTPWGNLSRVIGPAPNAPQHVVMDGDDDSTVTIHGSRYGANAEAVARYRERLACDGALQEQVKHALRGKDLACWCSPHLPCHADVLLELANAPTAPEAPNG